MKTPGIVIAGTNSDCGKTTLSMGIMAALVKKGMRVQPYKVGPDYIDPMFHTFITGRNSINLDSWMLRRETVQYLYAKHSQDADIAVVEGVMGFYDGYGGKSLEGSTADVAGIVGAPVILVINGAAMSLSAAALVRGFAEFDKNVNVKGVIINHVYGAGHFRLLKEVIEENAGVEVLGYLRNLSELAIGSRHLGLVTSEEINDLKEKADILAGEILETVDLERLIEIAKNAAEIDAVYPDFQVEESRENFEDDNLCENSKVRIAVAKNKAFCFYYQDNLELLEMLGAELVFFNPLEDRGLPEYIDGLYLGGGYPEIWAEELQGNHSMRENIRNHIEKGLPTYAECGGLMYLTQSIKGCSDSEYKMVGALPGRSLMTSSLQRFGYVTVKLTQDCILGKKGSEIRAHEFHYSRVEMEYEIATGFEVSKRKDGTVMESWNCGFKVHNLLAGYAHLHFWSNPEFAKGFVESCRRYKLQK